jgi:uncharacterized phage protein gp47/JayE
MSYPVDDTGFTAPTARELLEDFREAFEDEAGFAPDWDRDTFFGALSVALSTNLGDLSEAVQLLADSRSINNASGVILDDLCSLVGVYRQEATASTVDLDLGGASGTFVPAGKVVEDDEGVRWTLDEDATLPATGVRAIAQETGPITAPAGTPWSIATPVSGWDSVDNPADAVVGQSRESDAELLRRRARALQIGTTGTIAGIRVAVEQLDFVDQALVVDNPSATQTTVEGILLDPHSYAVIVFPNVSTTDDREDLAKLLLSVAPAGIKPVGTETEDVEANDGYLVTMRWNHATQQSVNVDVTVTLEPSATVSNSDVTTQIEDIVAEFFSELSVSETVKYHEVYDILTDVEAADEFDTISLTLDSGSANIEIPSSKVATNNTTVTVS